MLKKRTRRNLQWRRKNLKPKRSHAPGPILPNPALPATTHPRDGLLGVEVGPAPRLRGPLQLPPLPPSRRRTLSPFRCSAGCHRRAKPERRRAVPGLGVCCPFSTTDSGQPAHSQRSQAERSSAPRSARWWVSLSAVGKPRAASSFLQPPPRPPKEASSASQDPAPRTKGAARSHLPIPGGPDATPSAQSRSGISDLLPPSRLDKGDLSLAGRRRAAESETQSLKMREHSPELKLALRALSRPNRGQKGLALQVGERGRGP